jgi:hypothetical protein
MQASRVCTVPPVKVIQFPEDNMLELQVRPRVVGSTPFLGFFFAVVVALPFLIHSFLFRIDCSRSSTPFRLFTANRRINGTPDD